MREMIHCTYLKRGLLPRQANEIYFWLCWTTTAKSDSKPQTQEAEIASEPLNCKEDLIQLHV